MDSFDSKRERSYTHETANLRAWDANAAYWDDSLGDGGNDLFEQLILPSIHRLVGHLEAGCRILDLGTGNGMIARALAVDDVTVVATDYSRNLLKRAQARADASGKAIQFRQLDLMSDEAMNGFAQTISHDERCAIVSSVRRARLT